MIALEAHGLSKSFHSRSEQVAAVCGASLQLAAGEVVAIVGPSGSGKTTLLSMLGCVLAPDAGELTVRGETVEWSESTLPFVRRRCFGFVTQRFNLLASLNVRENVQVPLLLSGQRGTAVRCRALEALDRVALGHRAEFPVAALSGGERQRVAVARALIGDPPIVLADEPTASLDSVNGLQIVRTLRELATGHGKSVALVTHDERNLAYVDRVLRIVDGRIQEN